MFSLKSNQIVEGSVCIGLRASCRVCARRAKWRPFETYSRTIVEQLADAICTARQGSRTADCCARAGNTHAAAPSPAMNSRRRISHASEVLYRRAYRGQGCMGTDKHRANTEVMPPFSTSLGAMGLTIFFSARYGLHSVCRRSQCCESTVEERGAGNPHGLPTVAFGEQRKCVALCERLAATPLTHTGSRGLVGFYGPRSIPTAQRCLYPQRSGPLFALRSSRHCLLPALLRHVQRANRRLVHARAWLQLCRAYCGQSVRISLRSHRM
jgi:hypothetical protein